MNPPSTTSPHFSSDRTAKKARIPLLDRATIRLIVLAVGLPMLLISVLVYSAETIVSGTEFDPNTWQIRGFSFRRDPFSGRQLTGIVHDLSVPTPSMPILASYLINAKSKPALKRWDLVRISSGTTRYREPGPAAILSDFLTARDPNGNLFWDTWGKAAPNKASVLWPAVQDLVLQELYCDLPLLFEKALADIIDDEFRLAIHRAMLAILRDRAVSAEKLGEHDRAAQLAQLGLAYGDDAELSRMAGKENAF